MQAGRSQQQDDSLASNLERPPAGAPAWSLAMDSESTEETPTFRSVALLSAAPALLQPQPSLHDHKASLAVPTSSFPAVRTTKTRFAVSSTPLPVESTSVPTVLPQHGWKQPVLTDLSCFSFLEPYHAHVSAARLESLLQFLPQLFQQLSLHVEYLDSPILARATTLEQVGLCVSVVRDSNRLDHPVVLQVQRRVGCCIVFTKYAREIIQRVEDFAKGKIEAKSEWNGNMSADFCLPPPHCHGSLAQTVLSRCSFQQCEQENHHFRDVQDTSVLDDTSAMLQCFATRYLALEALTILTDPAKTTKSVVDRVSRVLLCDDESACQAYAKLVGTVVHLAVSGRWKDDEDDDMMDDATARDGRAQFLALQALVNAMHVVDCATGKVMVSFNQTCRAHTGLEWPQVLSERLCAAHHEPHAAYLAAKGLCRLHEPSPQGLTMPAQSSLKGVDPAAAKQAMLCPHAALQAASQQLLHHLGR